MTASTPIIYFDIDNTLIDASALVSAIAIRLVSRGLAAQEFESAVNDYYQNLEDTTNFDPQELITLLAQRCAIDPIIIEQEFFNPAHFIEALFPEIIATLETLSKTHRLGIFSQGNRSWQEQKLSLSGIDQYFDPQLKLIAQRKLALEVINQLKKNSSVVDDTFVVITTVASQRPDLQLFWLHRGAAEQPTEAIDPSVFVINSLSIVVQKLK
jgi:phosphoglycolate phosphatase-like HAD superfamily hydrolase